jgi:NAD(P)-dependent dehydrogenase (short-subunit alcohol dehydrogenase family)
MIQPGLRVLVTGGASGIGWAIAVALQEQGARVHLCDASPQRLAEAFAQQPEMSGTVADVASAPQIELGPHDIRVNALLPGIVEGERMRGVIAARADALGISHDEMEHRYLAQVSLRRMVTHADVAAMVVFLCSQEARNISGQSLSVCGNVETLR